MPCKPFLIWAGSKAKLLDHYTGFVPAGMTQYCDPFLGGGSVFFHLQPDNAILSDSNGELINTYRAVRGDLSGLIYELERISSSFYSLTKEDRKAFFLSVRKSFNAQRGSNTTEQAGRFIFLNKTCYGGIYRESAKTGFNTPYGNRPAPVICDHKTLEACHLALDKPGVMLFHAGFEQSLRRMDQFLGERATGFVFADPPYVPVKPGSFDDYQAGGFSSSDQSVLANALLDLPCAAVSCNSPPAAEFYPPEEWQHHFITAARAIGVTGEGRSPATEVIFFHP